MKHFSLLIALSAFALTCLCNCNRYRTDDDYSYVQYGIHNVLDSDLSVAYYANYSDGSSKLLIQVDVPVGMTVAMEGETGIECSEFLQADSAVLSVGDSVIIYNNRQGLANLDDHNIYVCAGETEVYGRFEEIKTKYLYRVDINKQFLIDHPGTK